MRELTEVMKTILTTVGITGAVAILAVLTAGMFAPAIAVALVGSNFAGLSGAALTSACLAYIGGGAIAAGGLGMAGGTMAIVGRGGYSRTWCRCGSRRYRRCHRTCRQTAYHYAVRKTDGIRT